MRQFQFEMVMKHTLLVLGFGLMSTIVEAKCPSPSIEVSILSPFGQSAINIPPWSSTGIADHNFDTFHLLALDTILINWNGGHSGCAYVLVELDGSSVYYSSQDYGQCRFATPGNYIVTAMGDGSTTYSFTIASATSALQDLRVLPYVRIAGATRPGSYLMADDLNTLGLLPLIEPYTVLGMRVPGQGGETTTTSVLAATHTYGIKVVDWVLIELRDAAQPSTVVASRAGLLYQSGLVLDIDGQSELLFSAPAGHYFISVRHRNHLGAMLSTPQSMAGPTVILHFINHYQCYGIEAVDPGTGPYQTVLWPGNTTFSTTAQTIKYAGFGNDRDAILMAVGGIVPTNTLVGYAMGDTNLDGVVKYVGAANDRDLVLLSVGGILPTQVRMEQLPY